MTKALLFQKPGLYWLTSYWHCSHFESFTVVISGLDGGGGGGGPGLGGSRRYISIHSRISERNFPSSGVSACSRSRISDRCGMVSTSRRANCADTDRSAAAV